MNIRTVPIDKPEDVNVILGQSHFIKSAEDLYEALVGHVAAPSFRRRLLRGVGTTAGPA